MNLTTRLFSVFSLVCLLSVGCASNASYPEQSTSDAVSSETSQGYERVYEIFGMDCPACHGGLTNIINEIDGVESSTANWETQRLTVTLKQGAELDEETIADAVARANFTLGKRIK